MESKLVADTLIVRGFKNEDILTCLEEACKKHGIKTGFVTGIGAVNECTVGVFLADDKTYQKHTFKGDFEILNLAGNVTTKEGKFYPHLHIVLCGQDNVAFGGHLNSGNISVTLELSIKILDTTVERTFDEEIGINMMVL